MNHSMNQRRRSLIALGAGAFTAALATEITSGLAVHAQGSGPSARIGFIVPTNAAEYAARLAAFTQGMRDNGLIEGKHYVLDLVYAEGRYERFPVLFKELLQRAPAVLMASTLAAAHAAQQATRSVPIVIIALSDPVGNGLVASLRRPGGNTTGVSSQIEDTIAKFVEFVREALPRAKRIALLISPGSPSHQKQAEQVRAAALKFGIETRAFESATPEALEATFAAIAKQRPDALVVLRDPVLNAAHRQISTWALKSRVAAFGLNAEFAEAGGLLSYGPSVLGLYRRAAIYVKKILAGTKPADLPVEQPTKFDLVINLKTAKALGIKIPQSLLVRAERVIE